jgi:hypothetical protein
MPSAKPFLEKQFRRMTLLPNPPGDPEAIKGWVSLMEPVLERYGEAKFELVVQRHLERGAFFPRTQDEFRSLAPASELRQCARCESSGIGIYIETQMRNGKPVPVAVKCDHARPA